jgi:lipopolysaccharide biosynthesis glycosyltransferase
VIRLKPIPIVFASDDFFVPYMSVTIQSIMENASSDRVYALFILHRHISEENAGTLKKQVSIYRNFSIEFINVTEYIENYSLWVENRPEISQETYFRLLIPYIFTDFEKVVYMDGDMICCADIAELYDMEIEDNLLISTRDIFGASGYYRRKNRKRDKRYEAIGIKNHDDYFIAGLLVFNNELFRKTIQLKEMLDLAISRKWTWHDQDILNFLCRDKVLFAPLEWDYYDVGEIFTYLPAVWKKWYQNAQQNIKIIHFAAGYKPWLNYHIIIHFELFWKYATRTPFIETIIKRMKKDGYIQNEGLGRFLINSTKHRQRIGLTLIIKCFFAWLTRDKK